MKNSVIHAIKTYIHHFDNHFFGDFNISENDNIIIGQGVNHQISHNIIAVKMYVIIFILFLNFSWVIH